MKIRSPRYHREIPQRYRYEAAKTDDGKIYFPPRVRYPNGQKALPYVLAQTGKIISWTVMHITMAEYADLTPYPVAIVELDDGARITAMIADIDPDQIKMDMRVHIEFRKIRTEGHEGLLCYGYKVVPD